MSTWEPKRASKLDWFTEVPFILWLSEYFSKPTVLILLCSNKKTAILARTFWNSCHLNVNLFGFAAGIFLLCVLHRAGESLVWWRGQWERSRGEVTEQEEGNCESEASCSDKGLVAVLVMLISSGFNVWGSFWSSLSPRLDLSRAGVEGADRWFHQGRVVLHHQICLVVWQAWQLNSWQICKYN